jgi:Na+-transporting methylmalonyl-CoA/oxaloacetate decarboxylase gamma subunit
MSAARLLKVLAVGALFAFLSALATASQVVGEVTLTIGKSNIDRAAGPAEPQKGGSVQEGDVIRTSDNGMCTFASSTVPASASGPTRFFVFTNSNTAQQTRPPLWFA